MDLSLINLDIDHQSFVSGTLPPLSYLSEDLTSYIIEKVEI